MDDNAAFMAAILGAPDEDQPRLVYADWLDENATVVPCPICCGPGFGRGPTGATGCTKCRGDLVVPDGRAAMAEFIRVQVELARAPGCHWPGAEQRCGDGSMSSCHFCEAYHALRARERELFERHKCAWFGERWAILYLGGDVEDADGQFPSLTAAFVRRGFPDEVRVGRVEEWLGGVCENCEGTGTVGRDFGYSSDGPCPDCGGQWESRDEPSDPGYSPGTGRTVGIGAAVVGRWPVTRVVVAEVIPHGIDRVRVSLWNDAAPRNEMSAVQESARVPVAVYAELERAASSYTIGRCCYYANAAAALDALSTALLRLAARGRSTPAP